MDSPLWLSELAIVIYGSLKSELAIVIYGSQSEIWVEYFPMCPINLKSEMGTAMYPNLISELGTAICNARPKLFVGLHKLWLSELAIVIRGSQSEIWVEICDGYCNLWCLI